MDRVAPFAFAVDMHFDMQRNMVMYRGKRKSFPRFWPDQASTSIASEPYQLTGRYPIGAPFTAGRALLWEQENIRLSPETVTRGLGKWSSSGIGRDINSITRYVGLIVLRPY